MNTYQKAKALALAHDIRVDQYGVRPLVDQHCLALSTQLRLIDQALGKQLMPRVQQFIDGEIAAFELVDFVAALKDAGGCSAR
jgi:hypothetical protein